MTTALSDAGLQFSDGNTQPYPIASVRQTVQSGTVDTSGLAAFGGSTGSTTVTAASTLIATSAYGATNRTGSITNPSWTGLSTNGTMYLFLDVAANNTCTTGSTTLAPTYRWGGADVTTNLQNTFNIQEMTMKVGNGSTASQVYRVFVGEVTVASGVVSAIVWYALNGQYNSGLFAWVANTLYSKNANVGVACDLFLYFSTTATGLEDGGTTNEEVTYGGPGDGANANFRGVLFGQSTRNVIRARTQDMVQVMNSSGTSSNPTSGFIRLVAYRRGF